jgi:HPt (histidine-containing phosphotransfer) domain-containing protein
MLHVRTAPAAEEPPAPAGRRAIDLDHLSRQTLGDRRLERETLAVFRRQARTLMFRLEATTDRTGRAQIAHLLQGSARGIGAPRLAEAAARLEQAAQGGINMCEAMRGVAQATAEAIAGIDEILADR